MNQKHTQAKVQCALLASVTMVLALVTGPLWLPAIGHWLELPSTVLPADAVVVFGGSDKRTTYGIELFQRGLAPQLWHTGYPKAQSLIEPQVLSAGVPASAFVWLSTESTWNDGERIAMLAQEHHLKRLLLVTDWYHSRRAVCSLDTNLLDTPIEFVFTAAPNPGFTADDWWQSAEGRAAVLSELGKFGFYTIRHGMAFWRC